MEAAGRFQRGVIGGLCAASLVATLVGALAFVIPPPVDPAVMMPPNPAPATMLPSFCPNQ